MPIAGPRRMSRSRHISSRCWNTSPARLPSAFSTLRTFWEKATILHEIAHRDELLAFPLRYSRHYYDLARLDRTYIGTTAVQNTARFAILSALRMQCWRAFAVIDLSFIAKVRFETTTNFLFGRNDFAHESLDRVICTLVAVMLNEILKNRYAVTTPCQPQLR